MSPASFCLPCVVNEFHERPSRRPARFLKFEMCSVESVGRLSLDPLYGGRGHLDRPPGPRIARPVCSSSFGPQFVRSSALCSISTSRPRMRRSRCLLRQPRWANNRDEGIQCERQATEASKFRGRSQPFNLSFKLETMSEKDVRDGIRNCHPKSGARSHISRTHVTGIIADNRSH